MERYYLFCEFWVLCDFFHESIYLWKALNDKYLETYFPWCKVLWMSVFWTLWDLYFNSFVWFEQSSYRGENDNIGHCGPIGVRNDPKTQEGSFSSSDRIDQKIRRKISKNWIKVMARMHSGNTYVMSVWSCVNDHFTGKRHGDRVSLSWVSSWFMFGHGLSFCPGLGQVQTQGRS